MLKFHMMDSVPIGNHLRSIQDVERPRRVIRMVGMFQNAIETQRHDSHTIPLVLIRERFATHDPCKTGADERAACNEFTASNNVHLHLYIPQF